MKRINQITTMILVYLVLPVALGALTEKFGLFSIERLKPPAFSR